MNKKPMLPKAYDPKPVEDKWANFWIKEGLFRAEASSKKPKFSMVLPPPNVTGSLHMGHALCFTLPDIIARWKRMLGYNVLWLPGTDHASIAVHNVIEQELQKKGLTRKDLSREEFLQIAWEWKEKYGGVITNQLKKMGFSLDWSRERFTMDEGFSRAVRTVFVTLYKEGLIYRDYYLVNHCPRCGTVLSDIEVEHKELSAKLYYIRYPGENGHEGVVVATTRPETMLGDTAVAVHPDDPRYKHLVGRKVILPLQNRPIPVIADESVEMDFGTGAVKVTPAHDPTDFQLGKKHNLEQVIVIDSQARMTAAAGPEFQGLDRFECREKVLEKLRAQGLLVKEEDYRHAVGHCYRCKTIIEPHLSWQWFVKIGPLAKEAIRVVEEGRIRFVPPNWAKTYFEWMYNIHDWCISRQLWWGHRIPAWYCQDCQAVMVEMEAPQECSRCHSRRLVQDEDILDTWFSSALWPFGTLGWPEETEDLRVFYPTDLMATGFDIIFFWVARMIMMGLKFMGDIPFRDVFINGLVRDFKKRKMSKSEGNIIDPLEMTEKYGTDALRFTLAALAIPGMDISLSEERMAGYRAFVNKIWNAARFVFLNLEEKTEGGGELTLADRWIKSRLSQVAGEINEALEAYKFYEAANRIYHFVWHEFCDWYLELVKPALEKGNEKSRATLVEMLDMILRLLHPFMPFVTEEIWQHLPDSGRSLLEAAFPQEKPEWRDKKAEEEMARLQELITAVRTIKAENTIPLKKKVSLWVRVAAPGDKDFLRAHQAEIFHLAQLKELQLVDDFPASAKFLKGLAGEWEVGLLVEEGLIELEKEISRLMRELKKTEEDIAKLEARLKQPSFLERAPQEVVEETRARLAELRRKKAKTSEHLSALQGLSESK
ncbi:MAG: valine--tRNA ligase [Candidatus Aminicenantes bacterium]|nr:MAG: valine--tRNA ligase [Candidatus Aminicenantes bacterium]